MKKKTAHRIWVWRAVKRKDWGIMEVSVERYLTGSNLFLLRDVLSIRYNIQLLP